MNCIHHVIVLEHTAGAHTCHLHTCVLTRVLMVLRVKSNLKDRSAARHWGLLDIGLRTRDLNSRVTEEDSRACVRDRHQLVNYHRLFGATQSAGSPRAQNKSSA